MTDDFYLIAITALLPLTAVMLVLQVNPYQALVMRGILGAIAALVYALFGAADVALTEALVGTMLSITLYAVAVRSSMEMRLGWVEPTAAAESPAESLSEPLTAEGHGSNAEAGVTSDSLSNSNSNSNPEPATLDAALVTAIHQALKPNHLRLEILAYPSLEALEIALTNKRIHSAVLPPTADGHSPYRIQTRVRRLYELLSDRLPANFAELDYRDVTQAPSVSSSHPQPQPSPAQSSPVQSAQESS